MTKRLIVTVCGAALLIAALPAEVRVKAVERKTGPMAEGELAVASGAVAIVCGSPARQRGESQCE